MSNSKINLLNFTRTDLEQYFTQLGEKPFRATQLIKWIHQLGVTDFAAMTNFSLALRQHLAEHAEIIFPEVVAEQASDAGLSESEGCMRKWLLKLSDNTFIETVFIPDGNRVTLCVSSQVGCSLGCDFCATGQQKFTRNLTTAEIIAQLWLAVRKLSPDKTTKTHAITNVVFMGMGEPLLNFDNVVKAAELMLDDNAYNLSKYKVTVSTSGIVPAMRRLREVSEVALAVSLHAPTDELRSKLMPVNKKYPLKELIAVCKDYYTNDRQVTIEYIMLAGINDSLEQARQLVKLLQGVYCKVNLIPANVVAHTSCYKPSDQDTIDAFRKVLLNAGINTITRKSRGSDIAAACGQLVGLRGQG